MRPHPHYHVEKRSLPEIKALVLPDVLHYPNDLQRQHVLPQICAGRDETGRWTTAGLMISCSLISSAMHYRAQLSESVWSSAPVPNARAARVKCDSHNMTCSSWCGGGRVRTPRYALQVYTENCSAGEFFSVCVRTNAPSQGQGRADREGAGGKTQAEKLTVSIFENDFVVLKEQLRHHIWVFPV